MRKEYNTPLLEEFAIESTMPMASSSYLYDPDVEPLNPGTLN